ncbi:MAG: hypothetical protein CMM07_02250 [Rhodopirellula sp.]|nr:hypothetical protein [Rhodopirellula sp.]
MHESDSGEITHWFSEYMFDVLAPNTSGREVGRFLSSGRRNGSLANWFSTILNAASPFVSYALVN